MIKLILIISSVIFIISSTELHELIRLPLLLKHYSQHRSEKDNLSLVDFLVLHYSENHPADNDDDDDNQLPFKSKESLMHIDGAAPFSRDNEEKKVFPPEKKIQIQYAEGIPDEISFSIFHPPRQV